MPVPGSINDLSTTPGANSPAGSESPATFDDYMRTIFAFIAQLRDGKAAIVDAVMLIGNQTVAGIKTLTSRLSAAGAYTPSIQPTHSATPTFDCAAGNVFEPAALTSNVTSMTMSNAVGGQTVNIRFVQDGTGNRTVAVPAGAKISGGPNFVANGVSWLIMTYSDRASRWEGSWTQVPA